MTDHLTEQQIESFRQRKMPPEGLLTAHQHLAVCEMCRERLSPPVQVAFAAAAFERELQQADAEDEHLLYQQLSGYVDDELGGIDREIVESHLETCAECAAEVSDLREFKSTITATQRESLKRPARRELSVTRWNLWSNRNPVRLAVAALIIILILTAAILMLRARFSNQERVQQAPSPITTPNLPPLPSPPAPPQEKKEVEPEKPSDKNPVRLPAQPEQRLKSTQRVDDQTPSPHIVVTLNDGERVVTLDSRGRIRGVAASAPGMQRMLAVALASQSLEKPHALERIIRGSSNQLGAGESSSFALQRPVGTVVESARPTFIWKPLQGASGYLVSVFDAQLNEVARSEMLTTTEWQPSRELQRGAIYRWQVIAMQDGREILSPSPTAPEAKFKVLEQQQAQALTRGRRRYANSHLALSVLYAQRGLLDEAETELRALVKDNPDSTVARKLLHSLQAWRPAGRTSSQDDEDVSR